MKKFVFCDEHTMETADMMRKLVLEQEEDCIRKSAVAMMEAGMSEKKTARIIARNFNCSEQRVYELIGEESEIYTAARNFQKYLVAMKGFKEERAAKLIDGSHVITLLSISMLSNATPEELFECLCKINQFTEEEFIKWMNR